MFLLELTSFESSRQSLQTSRRVLNDGFRVAEPLTPKSKVAEPLTPKSKVAEPLTPKSKVVELLAQSRPYRGFITSNKRAEKPPKVTLETTEDDDEVFLPNNMDWDLMGSNVRSEGMVTRRYKHPLPISPSAQSLVQSMDALQNDKVRLICNTSAFKGHVVWEIKDL